MFRLIFMLSLFVSSQAFGFMNIESIRQNAKEGNSGAVGLKANGSSGNSDRLLGEFSTLYLNRTDSNEYLVAGKYRYGESRKVKDAHDANLHLRYTRYFEDAPAWETLAQTEFDEFRKIVRRDLIGMGLRTLLEKQDKNAFYLGTGFFYEHEIFSENIDQEEAIRANIYLSFVRAFTETISANVIAYYQPSIKGVDNNRAQLDSSLNIELGRQLGLTIEYDIVYDSEPAPGVKQTDSTYMVGLNYSF